MEMRSCPSRRNGFIEVWVATVLALGFAALASFTPCYMQSGARLGSGHEPNLRILQANVFEQNQDRRALLDWVREIDADIVALQEVGADWASALSEIEPGYPGRFVVPRYTGSGTDLGLYWRVLSEEPCTLADRKLPACDVTLDIEGRKVRLLNVHTAAPFSPRRVQLYVEQMAALADEIAATDMPVIVAGDLNGAGWSRAYRDFIRKTGLIDARQGFGILGTWPSHLGPFRIPLDHILVSPGIEVVHCWTGPGIGSDHRPLIVDIYVPPAEEDEKQPTLLFIGQTTLN